MYGLFVEFGRFVQCALQAEYFCKILIKSRNVGPQTQGFTKMLGGQIELSTLFQSDSQTVVRIDVFWIESQGVPVAFDGALEINIRRMNVTKVAVQLGIIGMNCDCLTDRVNCLREISLLTLDPTEQVPGFALLRNRLYNMPSVLFCCIEAACVDVAPHFQ